MKIGEIIEGKITCTKTDGYGVMEHDGISLDVPGLVAGDIARVKVEHLSRQSPRGWAALVELSERSSDFVQPACPHAWPVSGRCGGCPLMHLTPAHYKQLKSDWTREVLDPILGNAPFEWHDAPFEWAYRNRCNYVPARGEAGEIILGSYAPRSHDVAPMDGCLVVQPGIDHVAGRIAAVLTKANVPLFPEKGGLRYLTVRELNSSKILVDLIVSAADAQWLPWVASQICSIENVAGVSCSVNTGQGNALRVDQSQLLRGEMTGIENVGGVEIELAASSFAQLNTSVAALMYDRVRPLVREGDLIWDLYCGAGSFGLVLAAHANDVTIHGAESVSSAIDLAHKNAVRNGMIAHYQVMDLGSPQLEDWPKPDLILVNPPRRGIDPALLPQLSKTSASRLIYMSCSPTSFAKDVSRLAESGWRMAAVDAYDMLPKSGHVELIASFI